MISKLFLLIILISSSLAQAFDKDFTTVNDRVPLEFQMVFDSLKSEISTKQERLRMIGIIKDINDNLGSFQKEHIFMLMKTEVIKNVLEHKFDKVRQLEVNTQLISDLEQDYKGKKKNLNRFSQWIWQSIIAELNHRKSLGIIGEKSFNPTLFSGAKYTEAIRFQKYLNYLRPWIDRMDGMTASEFNQLSKEIGFNTLKGLNERALLFKRYASTAAGNTRINLFNIPQKLLNVSPRDIKGIETESDSLTLGEESQKSKTEASDQMEKVTPLDMSTISDDVANELDKKIESKSP